MSVLTKGFVFSSDGDYSVGIPSNRMELSLGRSCPYDDDLKELQNAICATISDYIGENITTMTIEQETQNFMAENAYNKKQDEIEELFRNDRQLARGEFTEGLDYPNVK